MLLPYRCTRRRYLAGLPVLLAVVLAFSAISFAQGTSSSSPSSASPAAASPAAPPADQTSSDTSNSLAGAARKAKAQNTTHAKKVFTDEDMELQAGPLPRLKMDGAENADDVTAAIAKYKLTHTPQETEDVVRAWYDRYDSELAAAIQSNLDTTSLRAANMNNGNELCQQNQDYEDYQHCLSRQRAEQRGAQHDRTEISSNTNVVIRIQHSFMKIRVGLTQNGLRYDWFKVRTSNNIDRF
jgi:hypothetical protein